MPREYPVTIDGITYVVKLGSFSFYTGETHPYTFPGFTWQSTDQFGSSSAYSIWRSEALQLSIKAYTTNGMPTVSCGYLYVNGQQAMNANFGQSYGFATDFDLGLFALVGVLDNVQGIFITWKRNIDEDTETTLNAKDFIFIPMGLWNIAAAENPYNPEGQEYPGGTPDGGYGGGTANKGDATAGAVPTHPIRSGYGVHYMLVTDAQLTDFSNKMWGRGEGIFDTLWSRWKDYKFNPMAGVLTCHALPTDFYPAVAGAANSISIAGTSVPVSCTAVSAGIVQQTYTESLADILQYGSFLDFDYLKIYAHIPFCGICEIPPSACIGGSVQFIFRCDVLTGNVACWVCTIDRFGASHQINCLTGNCAYTVPITGNDNGMSTIIGALSSNLTAMVGSFEKGAQAFATGGTPGAGGLSAESSTANALHMLTAQRHTQVSGNVSGSAAILANNHLFLDITYANPSYPSTMQAVRGTPSDIGGSVGTFAGTFTVFSDVHADSISSATTEEKNMIEQALKAGVFV